MDSRDAVGSPLRHSLVTPGVAAAAAAAIASALTTGTTPPSIIARTKPQAQLTVPHNASKALRRTVSAPEWLVARAAVSWVANNV